MGLVSASLFGGSAFEPSGSMSLGILAIRSGGRSSSTCSSLFLPSSLCSASCSSCPAPFSLSSWRSSRLGCGLGQQNFRGSFISVCYLFVFTIVLMLIFVLAVPMALIKAWLWFNPSIFGIDRFICIYVVTTPRTKLAQISVIFSSGTRLCMDDFFRNLGTGLG